MKVFKLLLVSFWLLTMMGCGAKPSPLASPLAEPTDETVMTSPLGTPAPESGVATSVEPLVPGDDTGIVTGKLDRVEHDDGLPLEEWNLYLGRIVHAKDNENFEVARMEPSGDPYAHLNLEEATFTFQDIQPGKYALYTVTPRGESILLLNLDTGREIAVEVQAGEVVDLATLPVDFGF